MSRRWLLSLLCLSVFFLSLVQLTRARGEFKVSETKTRILFDKRPAELMLAVENSTGETLNTNIELEVIDPRNNVKLKLNQNQSIAAGSQKLNLPLPLHVSTLTENERSDLLWYRLRYNIKEGSPRGNIVAAGIISFSEITPDVFDLRVATSEVVRENDRLLARVQANHPLTRRPAANVQIDGEVLLNAEGNKKITLRSLKTTDSNGHALLEFVIPPLFPQFPYNVSHDDAQLTVLGRKGTIAAVVKGEVDLDQFARTLVTSDKPLYQPGQVMHIRALLFTPAKRALANQNASIRICDPDGTTVYRAIAKTSRFGVATIDWSIPENTRLGEYQIWVGVDGGDESAENGIPVRISRYELPNFTVNVENDRAYYLPGQNAEVRVRADYLFGKPVARGHVRVVRETERRWNYGEQKWEVDEGDVYEGDTDAKGVFAAQIALATDHEDIRDDDQQFRDFTYAAYFTDPTTNRTEQRRFDLRITREAIHVYIIRNDEWVENKSLPLKFYVSTSYADGSPAQVKVNVSVSDESTDIARPSFATVRTNRYGLAKVNGVRLPSEFADASEMELIVSAVDSKGKKGSQKEEISFEDDEDEQAVRVETDKSLYRSGEPITAFVTSSVPGETVVVDLLRESTLIRSERVKLHRGRGSVVFAYRPEFKDKLTLTAYGQTTKWRNNIASHAILYPRDPELKVDVRSTQARYRPGEEAQVNLSVRSPEGRLTESALGVVVIDKAVEERFRTDQEFGSPLSTIDDSFKSFQGADVYVAGMSLIDLQRLDLSKPISADMDLVADVLLSQRRHSFRTLHGDNQYERNQEAIFGDSIKEQLTAVRVALESRYARTSEYPTDEQSLRGLLLESKIDFNSLHDPWGMTYRTWFSIFQHSDDVVFESAGADKRFDTADDFIVYRLGWPYFRPTGEAINRAVNKYHDRTGKFVRDSVALREALKTDGFNVDQMLDRWGKPYRFEFDVKGSNYLVKIKSGGSDQQFADNNPYSDDFVIWTSSIDYFQKTREHIDEALRQNSENSASFPETEKDLRAVLQDSRGPLETLRDPWGRSYYVAFKTESFPIDRLQIEDRSSFGQTATTQTTVNPVIQTVRFISLRSVGSDAKPDTADDFSVAVFTGVLSEQRRSEPQRAGSGVVFQGNSGAIQGVVTDAIGAVISGTTVTATLSVERLRYQTSTNETGRYSFVSLPPGTYEIRFEATGFKDHVITNVLVRASHVTGLNVSLSPGAITETVTVSAGAEVLMSSATVSNTIRSRKGAVNVITKSGSSQQLSTPRLRECFPETLLWQPSIETDKQGRAQINFKLADNITTWKMVVVGSTEDGQIGMIEKEIKAFQPFFVDHDPPRVLTEGDEISLPVTVRNYLEKQQQVDLEIKPENWFSLIGPTRKQISVAPSDAMRETFDLRAIASIKNGKQRITAVGSDDSDAIEKPVTVHPDGEEWSVTDGDIIADRSVLELDIPETMIPNSKRAELKIYPNLMTHVVESVEGIMERPHGCGEQTISSTFPSLQLLRYYKQNGGNFPLRGRAERYLNEGYERLLTYRHESGGFTYWGTGQPDLALTAYALRFLTTASEVIAVDPLVIKGAREWLGSQQQPDGSWGYPVITAYVSRVLAQASPESSDALRHAITYLNKNVPASSDPYLLAQYALLSIDSGDPARAKPAIEKLRTLSRMKRTALYWTPEGYTPFNGWGLAGQVQATALVLQALSRYCDSQTTGCEVEKKLINQGLLFILKEKDRYGVWYSTQATINSLGAMLMLLAKQSADQGSSGETHVVVNGRVVQTVEIPVGDRLNNPITIDITEAVNPGKNRIEFRRAAGLPLASVQAVASFYVPWSDSSARNNGRNGLRLNVKFDKTEASINDEITCNVEAERVGSRGEGMLLAEIGLPPGAEVDRNSLEAAMKKSDLTINRYDVLPDRVVVYIWPRNGGVQFNFKFRPRLGMNARTAPSSVYDYYNPESRAVVAPATFKVR